jgi:hypothetical protein
MYSRSCRTICQRLHRDTPTPGKEKLVGSDASHAWFSVYIPELGWIDFDLTNNQIPVDQHIIVGWGRDYGDVAPLKDVIFGGVEHELAVSVDVRNLDEATSRMTGYPALSRKVFSMRSCMADWVRQQMIQGKFRIKAASFSRPDSACASLVWLKLRRI